MKYISSIQNPIVKSLAMLKSPRGRKNQNAFLAEGENMVKEALNEGRARTLLLEEDKMEQFSKYINFAGSAFKLDAPSASAVNINTQKIETLVFSKEAFKKLSSAKTPQGIACLCRIPDENSFDFLGDRLVLLNGVQDSGNAGTIWRTAEAAGFTGIIADEKSADFFSPKTISASKGACFRIPAKRVADLSCAFKKLPGFISISASLDGVPVNAANIPQNKIMLIIGSEGRGIDKELLDASNIKARIPMHGRAESLNAAVAAAIMMYSIAGFEKTSE